MTVAKREGVVEVKRGSQLDEILWHDLRHDFDLSERVENCLRNADIRYVGEIVQKTEKALLKLNNFGPKSLWEVKKFLAGMKLPGVQLQLGMQLDGWPGTPPCKGWPAASLPPVIVNMNAGAPVAQDDAASQHLKGEFQNEHREYDQVSYGMEVPGRRLATREQVIDRITAEVNNLHRYEAAQMKLRAEADAAAAKVFATRGSIMGFVKLLTTGPFGDESTARSRK